MKRNTKSKDSFLKMKSELEGGENNSEEDFNIR